MKFKNGIILKKCVFLHLFYQILLCDYVTEGLNVKNTGNHEKLKRDTASYSVQQIMEQLSNIDPQEQHTPDSWTKFDLLESLLDNRLKQQFKSSEKKDGWWNSYHDYTEIKDWLHKITEKCASLCELITIGKSYEGKPLEIMKIGYPGVDKPSIWIDGGMHAREWISPAVASYVIEKLINESSSNADISQLLRTYDWYVHPLVNPDGYNYTWYADRFWRKTRSINSNSSCIGTDPNRNFDHQWLLLGNSDPCSESYGGSAAFSEPESKSLSDFIMSKKIKWKLYLTLHSYGQLWMAPYGYSREKPQNFPNMMEAGIVALEALESMYGTQYTLGSARDILYQSSGTSRDWACGVANIPYVFTIELRDTGIYSFLLPPTQILPTAKETWAGIEALATHIQLKENL